MEDSNDKNYLSSLEKYYYGIFNFKTNFEENYNIFVNLLDNLIKMVKK